MCVINNKTHLSNFENLCPLLSCNISISELFELFNDLYKSSDELGSTSRLVLLDYSKAFDLIDHNVLLPKLEDMGVPPIILRWIACFLFQRRQRTKIGTVLSPWSHIHGGVPQGTKLGPLLFVVMINDLLVKCEGFKYVDDTTLKHTDFDYQSSNTLQEATNDAYTWSLNNHMKVNPKKTKEMNITFRQNTENISPITLDNIPLESVTTSKLLGVVISNDLKWGPHIEMIVSKCRQRLFFLQQLKRASVDPKDIVHIYTTVVRPILEYACVVWHTSLTKEQSDDIESIQRRALRIAYPSLASTECQDFLNMSSLHERRNDMCRKLFLEMQSPSHKLHHLLPPERSSITRDSKRYALPKCRTKRYMQSLIPWCLFNAQ